jgi:phage terminase large subunit-like protein
MFACRFGTPRIIVTMTPRPLPLVKELVAREDGEKVIVTRGSTYDNIKNLSSVFITEVIKPYEGTTLGRQELGGEILMDVEGALWNHEQIEQLVVLEAPPVLDRIVIGVDPSTSSTGNECGIVVGGKKDQNAIVLGDHSLKASPAGWGRKVVSVYHISKELARSCLVVAEKNQGGEMVSTVIHGIDDSIPIKLVHASVGKVPRAEPVAALYEQNRVKHFGHFPEMEDEMCLFVPGEMTESPNRVDALVWMLTFLLVKGMKKGRAGTWGRKAA